MEKNKELLDTPSKDSEKFERFRAELEGKEKLEEKLRCCLFFMKEALSQEKIPAFRDFWEAKRLCLFLFKESLPGRVRMILWKEYLEITEEVREVKKVLDEQSSFAEEQIDLAIQGLKEELNNFSTQVKEVRFDVPSSLKLQNRTVYEEKQRELDLFNFYAGRLQALRKELIKTQMRIRSKNRFFGELSKVGDQIFPRRKELIQEISSACEEDIDRFVSKEFSLSSPPYFGLKDQIKALQGFAKALTLSTSSFNKVREALSGCWEQIREKERNFREERAEQREETKKKLQGLSPKIEALKEEALSFSVTLEEAEKKARALVEEVKELRVGRDEMKSLRSELDGILKPLVDKVREEEQKQKAAEEEKKRERIEKQEALFTHVRELLDQAEGMELKPLLDKWEALQKEGEGLFGEGTKGAILESRLGAIFDHVQEKKWESILEENGEGLTSSLHLLLEERIKEKRKVKGAIEAYRKIVGGSSLNLEQSMLYQELLGEEKLRLDTIETLIEEIEEKLFDL